MSEDSVAIGVFWDIENCQVPKWKSALSVVQCIRDKFFAGHREAEFMCVCDILKERKEIIEELNSAQINIIHISATSKNAADDKIRQSLRRFADTHPQNTKVILISSDINFSPDLSDLRHRKNFRIILIHHRMVHESLLACAHEHYCFDDLVRNLPCRSPSKNPDGLSEVEVTGFPLRVSFDRIKSRLQKLSENCGGRVVSVTPQYALLKFSSHGLALRAEKRMDGEDVYGQKISARIPANQPVISEPLGSPSKASSKRSKISKSLCGSPRENKRQGSPVNAELRKPIRTSSPYRGSFSAPIPGASSSSPEVNSGTDDSEEGQGQTAPNNIVNGKPASREMLMLQQQKYQERQNKLSGVGGGERGVGGDRMSSYSGLRDTHRSRHWSAEDNMHYKRRHPSGSCSDDQMDNYMHYGSPAHNQSFCMGSSPRPVPNFRHRQNSGYEMSRPKSVPYDLDQYGNYWQQNDHGYSRSYSPRRYNYMNSNHNNNYQHNNFHNNYHNNYNNHNTFQPIVPDSSPPGMGFVSPLPDGSPPPGHGPVELVVTNLDYNISAKEWRKILFTTFHPHVKVLNVHVKTQLDNTCIGMIKVPTVEEARFAISQFHRKKIGYKRIQVSLKTDDAHTTCANVRAEAIALLQEAKGNTLPLFKFIELFDKRYHRSISVSELYKMRDILDIREQGGAGRMVYLAPALIKPPVPHIPQEMAATDTGGDKEEVLEEPVCIGHCPEGSVFYAEAMNSSMLPIVRIQLKTLAAQVHSLLQSHNGFMPLMSFPACYAAEFSPLVSAKDGVPLEHLISCVPGIQVQLSRLGVKKVQWMENQPPQGIEFGRQSVTASPLLSHQLGQISREVTDLLKHSPNCRMPVSKFIPAYHHHFGRQCRVADYGYTKLMELFEAIPYAVQVLGTGDRKMLTLSHRAQIRRFTADLLKVLKGQPGKRLAVEDFAEAFDSVFGKQWDVTEYGVCYIEDLLVDIPPSTLLMAVEEGKSYISVPKRDQTTEEMERTKQFALEVVDLLKHNPRCRMPFNKFIPAYHHHFGRQCRVADYGFTKLTDLFEAVPQVVELEEEGDERLLRLTQSEMRKVLSEQITGLLKQQAGYGILKEDLLPAFTRLYSFNLHLQDYQVVSLDALLARLRHIISLEQYNNQEYVVLMKNSELPPLALRVLQLLMDQSSGCLPLVELCSWYHTTFNEDCDVKRIKEELVDFVHVSGIDDGSAVIRLTALQTLARDIRHMLMRHGRIPLLQFDKIFQEVHGVEIKPALHGFESTLSLLLAIPHIVAVRGKPGRKCVQLSPAIKVPATLPASLKASPARIFFSNKGAGSGKGESSDSGVQDALDDEMEVKSLDLLGQAVPSAIPSPELRPALSNARDLIQLESPRDPDMLFLTDEEKRGQKTPLCLTPTSELLQFAAQCLVIKPPEGAGSSRTASPANDSQQGIANGDKTLVAMATENDNHDMSSSELKELLKGGWWKASPEQLQEVCCNFHITSSGRETPTDPLARSKNNTPTIETVKTKEGTDVKMEADTNTSKDVPQSSDVPTSCCGPAVNGAVGGSVMSASGSGSVNSTLKDDSQSFSSDESVDKVHNDVSFDEMFRSSMPLETSSTKSSTGSSTVTPLSSPRKSRPRIAARFANPLVEGNL